MLLLLTGGLVTVILAGAKVNGESNRDSQPAGFDITTVDINTGRNHKWLTRIRDSTTGVTCYLLPVENVLSCVGQ
jgi:hypothetical protein